MLPATPYSHVIITFNKSKYFITAAEHVQLSILGNGVLATMGDSTINTANIAEILTIDEFYRTHPDERPSELEEVRIEDVPKVPLEQQAQANRFRFHALLAGLKAYAEANPNGKGPKLFKDKIKLYESMYGPYDNKITMDEQFELDKIGVFSKEATEVAVASAFSDPF